MSSLVPALTQAHFCVRIPSTIFDTKSFTEYKTWTSPSRVKWWKSKVNTLTWLAKTCWTCHWWSSRWFRCRAEPETRQCEIFFQLSSDKPIDCLVTNKGCQKSNPLWILSVIEWEGTSQIHKPCFWKNLIRDGGYLLNLRNTLLNDHDHFLYYPPLFRLF